MPQTFRILSANFQHFFSPFSGLHSPGGTMLPPQKQGIVGSAQSMHGSKLSQRVDLQEKMYDTLLPTARHFFIMSDA
jgi:hypothetical protein